MINVTNLLKLVAALLQRGTGYLKIAWITFSPGGGAIKALFFFGIVLAIGSLALNFVIGIGLGLAVSTVCIFFVKGDKEQ